MFERRGEPRTSCSLNAIALFNDLRRDCLVVNISAHGARLRFRGFIGLPDKFDLYIPEEEITARAVVQWRHENEVGVALERRPVENKSDTTFLLDRIAQLEAEVRELRAHTMARAVPSL